MRFQVSKLMKKDITCIFKMKVKVYKKYTAGNMPVPGTEVEILNTYECFGTIYYLCSWNNDVLSIKENDTRPVIEYKSDRNGQLRLF